MSSTPKRCRPEIPRIRPTQQLLSPEDVARRCGLSRKAVYRAIERRELVATRICSRLRMRPADVDAWIDGGLLVDHPSPPPRRETILRHGGVGLVALLGADRTSSR